MALHRLDQLSSPEVAHLTRSTDVVGLVFTGATEQHGPHLPLSLDSVAVGGIRDRLGARVGAELLATPVIDVAISGPQAGYPGTISLDDASYRGLLTAHLEGLERTGVTAIAVIDFNAPNMGPSGEAISSFTERSAVPVAHQADLPWLLASLWRAADDPEAAMPDHAGRIETSLALALYESGRVGGFDEVVGFTAFDNGDWWADLVAHGTEYLSPIGVLGVPAGANAEEGRRVLDALADDYAAWLDAELGTGLVEHDAR